MPHIFVIFVSPLLINISSLFACSRLQLLIWLVLGKKKKKEVWLRSWILFTFFSLRVLWLWPRSNYWTKVGRYCSHLSFHNVASWNPLTLKFWLMASQMNVTWGELLSFEIFFGVFFPSVCASFERKCTVLEHVALCCWFSAKETRLPPIISVWDSLCLKSTDTDKHRDVGTDSLENARMFWQ